MVKNARNPLCFIRSSALSFLMVAWFFSACTLDVKGRRSSYKPTSAVMTTDRELVKFQTDNSHLLNHFFNPIAATGVGIIPSNTPFPLSGSGNVSGVGATTINAAVTPTPSILEHSNPYQPFAASISINAVFPEGAIPACTMIPASANSCRFQFALDSADFIGGQSLQARVYASNGGPNDSMVTNSLTVRTGGVQRLSSTSGGANDGVEQLTVMDDFLYFVAHNSSGVEKLFKTDGVTINQVSDTSGSASITDDVEITMVFQHELYFASRNSAGVKKLYKTNGTTVTRFSNTSQNLATSDISTTIPASFRRAEYKGYYYFPSTNEWGARKLYRTNGTTIELFGDTRQSPSNDDGVFNFVVSGGKLYYTSANSFGPNFKLYCTDGTSIVQLSNTQTGNFYSDNVIAIVPLNNEVFFMAQNPFNRYKWYRTNGANVILALDRLGSTLSDVLESGGGDLQNPGDPFKGNIYFPAYETAGNYKLYKSNGTTVTKALEVMVGGNDFPDLFTPTANYLYFVAQTSMSTRKLFRTDGTNMQIVSNTSGESVVSDDPEEMTYRGQSMYFISKDLLGHKKLYRTDDQKIVQITDINTADDIVPERISFKDVFYFTATDGSGNTSLYRLNE